MADNDRIRARAHEIWEAEGRPEGRDRDHWSQAEQEMAAAETGPGTAPVSAPSAGGTDAPAGAEPAGGPALSKGGKASAVPG